MLSIYNFINNTFELKYSVSFKYSFYMLKHMSEKKIHAYAKAAFILSLLFWLPALNIFTSSLAVAFGIVFLTEFKKDRTLKGRGLAIAAITIGAVTLALSFMGMVIYYFTPELLKIG